MSPRTPTPPAGPENEGTVRIADPKALRALAHAGRNRILERLQVHGPATATECARVAGMSPSAASYHLRLLERYGFVAEAAAEDEGRSDGRERLWRAVVRAWASDVADDDPQAHAVDMALGRVLLDRSDELVLAWTDASAHESKDWRDASLISNSAIVVTAEELQQVNRDLMAVLRPYLLRTREPATAPDGARIVHAALRLAPAVGDAGSLA
jgi:DNA-binding transcriptional ArsR family regulator